MNLVFIPFHDWKKCEREGFRTRDAHFMQEFSKHPSIKKMLVINRPISYSEIFYYRRNKFVRRGKTIFEIKGMRISQVETKLYILDVIIPQILLPFVMRRNWTSHAFGKDSFYKKVMFCLKFLDIQNDYVLFSSAPLFVPLIKKLFPKVFIFDAQDNLLKSALYRNVSNLQNYYNYCVENADLIYTNSPETASWLSTEKITAKFISNGVDLEMFSKNNQYVIPEDLKKFTKPIVGYAGKMQEIFDVELIKELLIKFPKTNFVFIGQILNPRWMKNLWTFPNAHYLGDKKYDLLPAYLHFFDICIVPISQTRQHGGDPIKIYEYIAAGKPVISTNTGGTEKLSIYPQVKVTGTQVEFISELSNFLNSIIEKKEIPFENISIEYTWNYKVNKFIEDISICLRVKDEKV